MFFYALAFSCANCWQFCNLNEATILKVHYVQYFMQIMPYIHTPVGIDRGQTTW